MLQREGTSEQAIDLVKSWQHVLQAHPKRRCWAPEIFGAWVELLGWPNRKVLEPSEVSGGGPRRVTRRSGLRGALTRETKAAPELSGVHQRRCIRETVTPTAINLTVVCQMGVRPVYSITFSGGPLEFLVVLKSVIQ